MNFRALHLCASELIAQSLTVVFTQGFKEMTHGGYILIDNDSMAHSKHKWFAELVTSSQCPVSLHRTLLISLTF